MENDKLRFRVWDNNNKKYIFNHDEICINQSGLFAIYDRPLLTVQSPFAAGIIIEQCTGQKDKNGKLIYEGDVVKSMIRTGYIKWNKGNMTWFVYVLKSNEIIALNSYLDGELEIIGNIHKQIGGIND